ncbi:unnamed protein product [Clavelina lepadiformis]|uniref:Cytochrome P450 n=1 Tax=Clavelina lepadiformis TaxID=159417 RepID=A0ABP0H382_CLALP
MPIRRCVIITLAMDVKEGEIFLLKIIYTLLFLSLVYIGGKLFQRFVRFYRIRKNLRNHWQGPKCHWFWGHLGMVTRGNKDPARFITFFTEKEKEFPLGFAIYPGPFRAVLLLHHPNIVKKVLSASAWEAPKNRSSYAALVPWLGEGLLVLNGHQWFRHRRLLTSAFHFDTLKPYVKKMNHCGKALVKKWSSVIADHTSGKIEVFQQFSLMALDTIMNCLLSYEPNAQMQQSENIYVSSIYTLSKLIIERGRNKNLAMVFNFFYKRTKAGKDFQVNCDKVHQFSNTFMKQRRNEIADMNGNRSHFDFLDILLSARDTDGNGLVDSEIRAEMDTFLFRGHDTTASALSWTLFALASHPQHQDKCAAEIMSVLGGRDEVSWSDLSSFPYLTRCIKESLRMYPPVPVISRRLDKDIGAEGKTILKGTVVQISIIGVQRSELFWKDPQTFNPDRFTTESASQQNHHAFIPFSAGPRNCIGQNLAMNEIKVVLAHILQKFKLTVDHNHKIVHCHELIYRARGGLYLYLEKREDEKS